MAAEAGNAASKESLHRGATRLVAPPRLRTLAESGGPRHASALEAIAVARRRYRTVDTEHFPGLSAFQTRQVVFGRDRRMVVTHSQHLHAKQARGFEQTLAKARRQLAELAARLARGRTRKPPDRVDAAIDKILKPRWLSRVISTSLTGDTPPSCASTGAPAPPPAPPSPTNTSASGSCSPTTTTGPSPKSSRATAPSPTSRPTSAR